MKRIIINIIITILVAFIAFYITLPAININNPKFYLFVGFILLVYGILDAIRVDQIKVIRKGKNYNFKLKNRDGAFPIILAILGISFILILLTNFICSPIFNAKSYQQRITVETGNFTEDIEEVNFNQLPLLDKSSSQVLGDRVMGEISELVSQYYVSSLYTQINYNNEILRVTPLEYADFFKWLSNKKHGVVGYITVNSVNGESKLKRLDKGMKYVSSGYFNDNLERKLRFSYPFENFGKISFEIDNEGNPYYIVTTIKYTAFGLKAKVKGVIIFDPITGDSKKYDLDDIPTWVDVAYSASLIIEQVDDWGSYKNGYWNSIFGQKDVVNTTEGYNYLAMNDDVYLYTGITSVVSDESNLGFILTNMRTGKTTYYNVPGAEEYSAMSSAEGQVQDMGYVSTFPLLINLNNRPTYLVSLKDSNGLVKMYGFVDVKDYQKVSVTDVSKGILVARDNYLKQIKVEAKDEELTIEEIKVDSIKEATINGNSIYYIEAKDKKFKAPISLSDNLPFIKVGDTIKIGYYASENDIIEIEKIY